MSEETCCSLKHAVSIGPVHLGAHLLKACRVPYHIRLAICKFSAGDIWNSDNGPAEGQHMSYAALSTWLMFSRGMKFCCLRLYDLSPESTRIIPGNCSGESCLGSREGGGRCPQKKSALLLGSVLWESSHFLSLSVVTCLSDPLQFIKVEGKVMGTYLWHKVLRKAFLRLSMSLWVMEFKNRFKTQLRV